MARPTGQHGVTIGVDIGGTHVRAARVDPDGTLSDHVKVRSDSAGSITGLVRDLCLDRLDERVSGIGIGIPGRLDRDRTTVRSAGFLDLAGVRLADVIGSATGRPVILDNDAHMALSAELRIGAATGAAQVVLFTIGTGIGGAVAAGGVLLRGRGNAGQLGHLALDRGGPECRCGRRGCSETLASGTALVRLATEAGLGDLTSAEELLEGARTDPVAADVMSTWARAWRDAVDTVVAVLDPDLVVLGGGLGAVAAEALERYAPATSEWFECAVTPALLGDDAGVIGAGLRAFDA